MPEHGPWERFLIGSNVNTPFFRVPTPEFGHVAHARVQGLDLVRGHWTGHWYIGYQISEHSTILCLCPGTSAPAPSVNTALGHFLIQKNLIDFNACPNKIQSSKKVFEFQLALWASNSQTLLAGALPHLPKFSNLFIIHEPKNWSYSLVCLNVINCMTCL